MWSGLVWSGPASKRLLVTSKETIKCSRMAQVKLEFMEYGAKLFLCFLPYFTTKSWICKMNIPLHQLQLDAYRNESLRYIQHLLDSWMLLMGRQSITLSEAATNMEFLYVSKPGLSCGNLVTRT